MHYEKESEHGRQMEPVGRTADAAGVGAAGVQEARDTGAESLAGRSEAANGLSERKSVEQLMVIVRTFGHGCSDFGFAGAACQHVEAYARALLEQERLEAVIEFTTGGRVTVTSVRVEHSSAETLNATHTVTMEDALAAGDGTLHGAIDYWQGRAIAAEAMNAELETMRQVAKSHHDDLVSARRLNAEMLVGLKELLAAEEAMFPAEKEGLEAQKAWSERRSLAKDSARALITRAKQIVPEPVNADLLAALKGVVAVADRKTDEFDLAHAAIARAEAAQKAGT
jgi:hypothetical protein